jgi:small subunit ribosomal protein S9
MPEKKKEEHAKRRGKRFVLTTKAKKKSAVARARLKKGNGKITINCRRLELVGPRYVYDFIREPLLLAGPLANEVDVDVNVRGGGFSGQAVSVRSALAKALIEYSRDEKLKQKFLAYDRLLLVDDVRKTEPKKPLGTKARKKKQCSKR